MEVMTFWGGHLLSFVVACIVSVVIGVASHVTHQGTVGYADPGHTQAWELVTLDTAVWLAPLSSGREDWSGCEIRWGATMSVRCPDGYTLEME